MEYRKLPKGEERISILGMGTSSIGASGEKHVSQISRMDQITSTNNYSQKQSITV